MAPSSKPIDALAMTSSLLRAVGVCTTVLMLSLMPHAVAALTIADAIDPIGVNSATLSPDGKHIAIIARTGLNHGLMLIDAQTMSTTVVNFGRRVVDGYWIYNKEPRSVTWAGNDLLAVDYGVTSESITLDGKKVAELASSRDGVKILGRASQSQPDSPMLLVMTDLSDNEISLVNARTGRAEKLRFPMRGKPVHWAFDKLGRLRAVTLINSALWKDATTVSNWYRDGIDSDWVKLAEFKITDDAWIPLHAPEQEHSLVILSRNGTDRRGVYRYDTVKRETVELMAGHATQDIVQVFGIQEDAFQSVLTDGMLPQRYWFDSLWARLQLGIDKVLPNRINVLSGDPKNRVLVFSYGDVDPGRWFLFDTVKATLQEVVASRPSVKPEHMRSMAAISYPAKDGLTIPAFLTRPKSDLMGPAPTVVLVHGGPTVRDRWQWSPDVQLLTAQGYVVFQPQFRGSTGFGKKFEEAGYGQWGLAMQDDITAGVEYLINQGIADPKRICIYGASYGGYAALWGLVKTPDLYRCGVSFAGVSDIELMFTEASDTNQNTIGRQILHAHIGDPARDKEKFDQVSPYKHADKISAPLLLMHGDEDKRVPIAHSEKMKRALSQHKKHYEWSELKGEGHSLRYVKSNNQYYETLLKFLAAHLAPAETAAATTAK